MNNRNPGWRTYCECGRKTAEGSTYRNTSIDEITCYGRKWYNWWKHKRRFTVWGIGSWIDWRGRWPKN